MSWEGYYQLICKNGHMWTEFAEYRKAEECICPKCNTKPIWYNIVDITNGSFEGNKRIDGYIELKPSKIIKCKHCGSILEIKYRIPKKKVK